MSQYIDLYVAFILEPEEETGICVWLFLGFDSTITLLTLILNSLVFIILMFDRTQKFNNVFYSIITVFVLTMMINRFLHLVLSIVTEAFKNPCTILIEISLVVDLFNSYYSALLIFLLGLNRLAVYTFNVIDRIVFRRIGLVKYANIKRKLNKDMGVVEDTCTKLDLMRMVNYIFYMIPLISSVFYLFVYNSLRSQRAKVVTGKTKTMLDKAEKCTLNQGIFILLSYLIALITHALLQFYPPNGLPFAVLLKLGEIVSMAPQIGVPLIVLCCSNDARKAIGNLLYITSTKNTFSFKKSQVSSESKENTRKLSML
uniref:G_PROTEIN_RECEP_F1_2 domain-containing protein n=1 Tax=Heterorhabditis bacteriophora TaxID=37862 RepID=A0A1I7XCN1_HETBA